MFEDDVSKTRSSTALQIIQETKRRLTREKETGLDQKKLTKRKKKNPSTSWLVCQETLRTRRE